MSATAKLAVTTDGQSANVKHRRERNGKYTQHIDISQISGIQFDSRHENPLVEVPPVELRDDDGVIYDYEEQGAGTVLTLCYDEHCREYSLRLPEHGPAQNSIVLTELTIE